MLVDTILQLLRKNFDFRRLFCDDPVGVFALNDVRYRLSRSLRLLTSVTGVGKLTERLVAPHCLQVFFRTQAQQFLKCCGLLSISGVETRANLVDE